MGNHAVLYILALLLCSLLCSAQNVTQSPDSQQAINVKILVESSPSAPLTESSGATITITTPKPESNPTAKSSLQAHEIEEEDYNFHRDRLPALTEDEESNLSEDANPLHFLKTQPPHSEELQVRTLLKCGMSPWVLILFTCCYYLIKLVFSNGYFLYSFLFF